MSDDVSTKPVPYPANAERPFDVAIIGGGAAGVLVAIHLLRRKVPRLRIVLIEPRERLAEGAAYSTRYREHLLNVVASRMSAFDDEPDDFVRFLREDPSYAAIPESAIGDLFARRIDFGRYLRSRLDACATKDTLCWLQDEAVDVAGDGIYTIDLRSGYALRSRCAVLATGNFPRAMPSLRLGFHGDLAIKSAWHYEGIRDIEPEADVCILGSGLSMVDAVVSLAATGHRGHITVISRHGLVPLSHATPTRQHGQINELLPLRLRLSERSHWLRSKARDAEQAGQPWQRAMDCVRPQIQILWHSLGDAGQRRFLSHAARLWDVHRHRIAPAAAATIDHLRSKGRLDVVAGRLIAIARERDHSVVQFLTRRQGHWKQVRVRYVINCTGVESNMKRVESPLMARLLASKTVHSGPHGIGLATNDIGALVTSNGKEHPNFLTLGSSRIGQLWESIAIPELRRQADALSSHLLECVKPTAVATLC